MLDNKLKEELIHRCNHLFLDHDCSRCQGNVRSEDLICSFCGQFHTGLLQEIKEINAIFDKLSPKELKDPVSLVSWEKLKFFPFYSSHINNSEMDANYRLFMCSFLKKKYYTDADIELMEYIFQDISLADDQMSGLLRDMLLVRLYKNEQILTKEQYSLVLSNLALSKTKPFSLESDIEFRAFSDNTWGLTTGYHIALDSLLLDELYKKSPFPLYVLFHEVRHVEQNYKREFKKPENFFDLYAEYEEDVLIYYKSRKDPYNYKKSLYEYDARMWSYHNTTDYFDWLGISLPDQYAVTCSGINDMNVDRLDNPIRKVKGHIDINIDHEIVHVLNQNPYLFEGGKTYFQYEFTKDRGEVRYKTKKEIIDFYHQHEFSNLLFNKLILRAEDRDRKCKKLVK